MSVPITWVLSLYTYQLIFSTLEVGHHLTLIQPEGKLKGFTYKVEPSVRFPWEPRKNFEIGTQTEDVGTRCCYFCFQITFIIHTYRYRYTQGESEVL